MFRVLESRDIDHLDEDPANSPSSNEDCGIYRVVGHRGVWLLLLGDHLNMGHSGGLLTVPLAQRGHDHITISSNLEVRHDSQDLPLERKPFGGVCAIVVWY